MSKDTRTLAQSEAGPDQPQSVGWAAIKDEILQAISQGGTKPGALQVDVGATGIVLWGEVVFRYQRELASLIVMRHAQGLKILNRVRVLGQPSPSFFAEPEVPDAPG